MGGSRLALARVLLPAGWEVSSGWVNAPDGVAVELAAFRA
jgi:hypothetical protein